MSNLLAKVPPAANARTRSPKRRSIVVVVFDSTTTTVLIPTLQRWNDNYICQALDCGFI